MRYLGCDDRRLVRRCYGGIKFEVTDAVSFGGQPLATIGELDVLVK